MLLEALLVNVVDICIMHHAAACEVYNRPACTVLTQARPHDVTSHRTSNEGFNAHTMYMCTHDYTVILCVGSVSTVDILVHLVNLMYSLSCSNSYLPTYEQQRVFDPVLLIASMLKELASSTALCRRILCHVC